MGSWNETATVSGPRLLPAGIRNFQVVSAVPRINDFNGRRQVVFTLNSADGGGEYQMDLEAGNPQHQGVVDGIIKSTAVALGFEPQDGNADLHQVILPQFIGWLPNATGAIVDVNVKHESYHRKKDGAPMFEDDGVTPVMGTSQKVYFNKLVQRGGGAPAQAAAPAGFAPTDFVPVGGPVQDDDIPF